MSVPSGQAGNIGVTDAASLPVQAGKLIIMRQQILAQCFQLRVGTRFNLPQGVLDLFFAQQAVMIRIKLAELLNGLDHTGKGGSGC